MVDRTQPLSGDQCNVWLDGDDQTHPWPRAAIALNDLRPLRQARAIIAARGYNQTQSISRTEFPAAFSRILRDRAAIVGAAPGDLDKVAAKISELVLQCADASVDQFNNWNTARVKGASGDASKAAAADMIYGRFGRCWTGDDGKLNTYGLFERGPPDLIVRFDLRDDGARSPFHVLVEFTNAAHARIEAKSLQELRLNMYDAVGVVNFDIR